MKKLTTTALIVVGALSLAGCTSTQTNIAGAAIGGATGAVVGGAVAGTPGAILGAAGGGAAGVIIADEMN